MCLEPLERIFTACGCGPRAYADAYRVVPFFSKIPKASKVLTSEKMILVGLGLAKAIPRPGGAKSQMLPGFLTCGAPTRQAMT